jgi:mRNA interferase HigB
MHVISIKPLRQFWEKHADSEEPLRSWFKVLEKTNFLNFAELRNTFNSVDKVDDLYVFNVHGNHVRVVAQIKFRGKRVFIRLVLTHAEYDKGDWKHERNRSKRNR